MGELAIQERPAARYHSDKANAMCNELTSAGVLPNVYRTIERLPPSPPQGEDCELRPIFHVVNQWSDGEMVEARPRVPLAESL